MSKYDIISVSESTLEDLVRQYCDKIESGLRYLTHQKQAAGGRLDVLFADAGNGLVVAELKVVEDDDMLFQAIDYYDYLAKNLEGFSRLLSAHKIDPKQNPRILLIAPSYSQQMLNRVKWISAPISLFRYQIISISGEQIPIFIEEKIEATPVVVKEFTSTDEHVAYIKDASSLARAKKLIADFQAIDRSKVTIDPIKYAISFKYSGTVFAYFSPRRQHFVLSTYNKDGDWTNYPINTDDEFKAAYELATQYIEKLKK